MASDTAPETVPVTRRSLGAEVHVDALRARRAHFARFQDFTQGRGLELGPLDAAISDRSRDDVRYVDVFDQVGTQEHYREDPNVLIELIPHIDFPLIADGKTRSVAEAAAPGAPYDWLIASHVIEHVPDVIGWLQQLGELAADGARLVMAVPDRRYCFDRHRPATTTGQALLAHEMADTRPGTRALYDHFSANAAVDTVGLWKGAALPGREARVGTTEAGMTHVRRGRAGEYVDCHVWTFGPGSFVDQVREWRELGLCEWYVETVEPQPHTVEFLAVLRRAHRDGSAVDVTEPAPTRLPGWLDDEAAPFEAHIAALEEKVANQRARIRRLRARNDKLQRRLAAVDVPVAARVKAGIKRRLGR